MSTQIRGNKQIKNITIQNEQLANGTIELNKLKEGTELLKRDGSVVATGDFDLGNNKIKNLSAPVDSNDAVRKADLDAVIGGSIVTREIPTGSINGSNTQFTLANTPNIGTEQVFLNGALLNTGGNSDYSIDGNAITFTIAPQTGDTILVNYITDMIVVSLDINTTLTQFNSRLTTSENELFTAQGDIAGAQTNISNLQSRVTTAEADIVALEGNVSAAQGNISTLQSGVSTLQSGLSSEITARQNAVSSLSSNITTLQSADTTLGNRVTATEGDISALESADEAFDLRIGVIEDGLQAETNARISADNGIKSRLTALEGAPAPATSLSALTDVSVSSPTANQILKFNGTNWVNGAAPSTFSGSYNDLTNKPSIPSLTQVEADIADHESRLTSIESAAFVTREVPSGSVNGSNAVFTLANTPVAGTEQVFLNGILQTSGVGSDYTISGSTITFATAPDSGWNLFVNYATGSYTVAPAGSGSGSIEVYQDSEFTWTSNNSSTTRTITHNKGKLPDMVKVFVKRGDAWVEHIDRIVYQGVNYGWDANNSESTVNAHKINLWVLDGSSPVLCRIRLYWFGNNDIATQSAGAFSIGGSSVAEYTISEFTHPLQTGQSKVAYTITHNLNTLYPTVIPQVYTSQGEFGSSVSGWANIPDYFGVNGWADYVGHLVEIVNANTIRLVLFNCGAGSRQIRGIVKK